MRIEEGIFTDTMLVIFSYNFGMALAAIILLFVTRKTPTNKVHVFLGVVGASLEFYNHPSDISLLAQISIVIFSGLIYFSLAKIFTSKKDTLARNIFHRYKKSVIITLLYVVAVVIFSMFMSLPVSCYPYSSPQLGQNIITNQCHYYDEGGAFNGSCNTKDRIPWYAKEGCDDLTQVGELGPVPEPDWH